MLLERPTTEAPPLEPDADVDLDLGLGLVADDRHTTIRRSSSALSEILLSNGERVVLHALVGSGSYPPGYLERLRTTGEC
jgi:hypothetical protein